MFSSLFLKAADTTLHISARFFFFVQEPLLVFLCFFFFLVFLPFPLVIFYFGLLHTLYVFLLCFFCQLRWHGLWVCGFVDTSHITQYMYSIIVYMILAYYTFLIPSLHVTTFTPRAVV